MEQEITRILDLLPSEFRPAGPAPCQELAGGSDRRFIRIHAAGKRVVVLYDAQAAQLDEYAAIQRYLWQKQLGGPELYFYDPQHQILIMEDLGDLSLDQAVHQAKNTAAVEWLYKQVIDFLIEFQIEGFKGHEACVPLAARSFDYTMLRWETGYFRENFLEKYCGMAPAETAALEDEFESLAQAVIPSRHYLMHRDFQSKNIIFKDGRVRIVDFQAARKGIFTYDLAALVRDPYVALPIAVGDKLTEYYLQALQQHKGIAMDRGEFDHTLEVASLQRLMQALGAYSFLSLVKKKDHLRYIPPAMHFLESTLGRSDHYPKLTRLVGTVVKRVLPDKN